MFVPSAWAEQPSEIDTMHHLTSGSLSAQRGSILLLLQEDEENILQCVRGSVFFSFSFRVLGVRGDLIQNAENYCYELSVFLSFFKRFYKYSHSSFNSSDLICCQMHANCEGAGIWTESFMSRCWCMKKKQTAFFRNAIIPPPSVFAVTGMFRFYRLSVIMMTLLVFLPLHWLCACICVSCSVFCFSSPSTTANELINITSLKRISYFNIYF